MGFGKQNTGIIMREHDSIALGALDHGVVKVLAGLALTEDFRMLKSEIHALVVGLSTNEGTGLLLGITNGELTEAEIAACINLSGPLDRNDRGAAEVAERFVKLFAGTSGNRGGGVDLQFVDREGGPRMEIKPRWTFSDPEGWAFFVYNNGTILTTGATIHLVATHYGVWVT